MRLVRFAEAVLVGGGLWLGACAVELRAAAPTATRPDAQPGWLRVDAGPMGLSFAMPAPAAADVTPRSDYESLRSCEAATPQPEPQSSGTSYKSGVCLRAGERRYFVGVVVGRDDGDVRMFEHTIGHSQSRADHAARTEVSGYVGVDWVQTRDGTIERSRGWIAGRRLYLAVTTSKVGDAAAEADATRFFASLTMLDRP